jgi:hypothetical protein
MKRQPLGLYAIALAILVVGLVALGVPAQTLLSAALVLACPLMMIFMWAACTAGTTGMAERMSRATTVTTTRPPAGGSPAGSGRWRSSR